MIGQPAPPARPQGIDVWWMRLGRIVVKLCAQRAHCDVVITIKDGSIQLVRVNQSFQPNGLPDA
jgi:hypothetical protein